MAKFRSTRVVIDDEIRPAVLHVEEGHIVEIGGGIADHDFGDLMVMPGLVDSHVHVNEPGRTSWEGFASATRAAAAGGTTTIVDMPLNSIPPTVDLDSLSAKRTAADDSLAVDVAFWGGLVPGSASQLATMTEAGVCGFKAFLVDSGVPEFPPVNSDELRKVLKELGRLGLPALVHAEDQAGLSPVAPGAVRYHDYLASRPEEAESRAVALVSELAGETGANVHVLHVSSAMAVQIIAESPPGLTGETCPHYLTFAAEDIPDGATQFKCAPPIREAEHREALWQGLLEGGLEMVVSDHSPSPPEMKHLDRGDFSRAWGGIASLQLRLPATWTGAAARGADLTRVVEWTAAAPARLAGLDDRKGAIEMGKDADLVVFDPDDITGVRGGRLLHRHPITPYEGMRLRGRVVATILRGKVVYNGSTVSGTWGRMLARR